MSRTAAEFKRIYGGHGRRVWQQDRPCDLCGAHPPTEMAHVTNGGMGRKADACYTISACRACHHELDHGIGKRGMERRHGVNLKMLAKHVDNLWNAEW